jgi:Domain of unknown function (DUF4118)
MAKLASGWWLHSPVIWRCGVAVVSVVSALTIEQWMQEQLVGAPVSLFLCAVMLSAWFGGFGPGLFAAALAVLAFYYYLVSPVHSFSIDPREVPRLAIFALSVLLVGSLSAAQRRVAESLRNARDELASAIRNLQQSNKALLAENAERHRAEEALRQSEQRFRDYAETGSDWLWETGPDHAFVQISGHLNTVGIEPRTPGWTKAVEFSRAMWTKSPRNGASISLPTRRINRFEALSTRCFVRMGRAYTSERAASPFLILRADSSAIGASIATSRLRFKATKLRRRFATRRPNSHTSLA